MATEIEVRGLRRARLFLLIAVIYLLLGVTLGNIMGATLDFTYAPVHAHLNLLGWVTLALSGLIYHQYPAAGGSRLGAAHFWLQNLILPVQLGSLFLFLGGNKAIGPLLGISSVLMALALLLLAVNLFLNTKPAA